MNKYILLILLSIVATTTSAQSSENQALPTPEKPKVMPILSTEDIRGILNALDKDDIGSIMGINVQSPTNASVLIAEKLPTAQPDDDGALIEFEKRDGSWVITGKGNVRMH